MLLVVIATLVIHALPRARGLDFPSSLRYVFVLPASIAFTAAWVLTRRGASAQTPRLRALLCVGLGVIAGIAGYAAALRTDRDASTAAIATIEAARASFGATPKFLDLPDGVRVHYVDEGSGPVLLFLHGNPAWSFQWRTLIGQLRDSYRCVALDYPGFGLSTAPRSFGFGPEAQSRVVEAFVDRLALKDITLVAQDWGGPIGLGMAGRRPDLVAGVVLGNTWAWRTDPLSPRGLFSLIAGGPIGEFLQVNFNGVARFAVDQGIVGPVPREIPDGYSAPFLPRDRRGIAAYYPGQILAAGEYFDRVEAGLHRLANRPALIFWGLRDPGFPREDLERFERAFPNHRTVPLPAADHFFFEDAPSIVVAEIRRFAAASRDGDLGR